MPGCRESGLQPSGLHTGALLLPLSAAHGHEASPSPGDAPSSTQSLIDLNEQFVHLHRATRVHLMSLLLTTRTSCCKHMSHSWHQCQSPAGSISRGAVNSGYCVHRGAGKQKHCPKPGLRDMLNSPASPEHGHSSPANTAVLTQHARCLPSPKRDLHH